MTGATTAASAMALTPYAADEATRLTATARLAMRIAAGLTIAVCAVALVVGLAFVSLARRWLAFPFAGIPASPGEGAAIFGHNVRALTAIGGLLLIARSPHWAGRTPGAIHRTIQCAGEALLAGAAVANVIVVGASLGAYGVRMVRAALPHGPVELAAYSLALALYVEGRRRPLPVRHVLAVAALSTSALAAAALLEAFVSV